MVVFLVRWLPKFLLQFIYILKNLGRINEWLKGNLADYQSSEQKEMVSQLVKFVDNEVSRYFDVKAVAERSRSNVGVIMCWIIWILVIIGKKNIR